MDPLLNYLEIFNGFHSDTYFKSLRNLRNWCIEKIEEVTSAYNQHCAEWFSWDVLIINSTLKVIIVTPPRSKKYIIEFNLTTSDISADQCSFLNSLYEAVDHCLKAYPR